MSKNERFDDNYPANFRKEEKQKRGKKGEFVGWKDARSMNKGFGGIRAPQSDGRRKNSSLTKPLSAWSGNLNGKGERIEEPGGARLL